MLLIVYGEIQLFVDYEYHLYGTLSMPELNEELLQFGRNLAKLRKEKKITQEELAYLANVDRSYISGVESGYRNIALLNILKLARALKVDAKVLLEY